MPCFTPLPTGRVDGGDGGKAGPRMRLRLSPSAVEGASPPLAEPVLFLSVADIPRDHLTDCGKYAEFLSSNYV